MSGWWHTKAHSPKTAIADERRMAHQSKAPIADEVTGGSFRSPYVRGSNLKLTRSKVGWRL